MHCGQNVELMNVKPGGTYNSHSDINGQIPAIKTNQLMLYREIIAVCSQINTKHINALWAERRIVEC